MSYTQVKDIGFNLAYSKEFKVIICKDCKSIVNTRDPKSSIKQHFTRRHNSIIKDVTILEQLNNLNKAYKIVAIDKIAVPSFNNYLFKDLEEPKEAFLCTLNTCSYITTTF